MRYEDPVTGYLWKPVCSNDHIVIASKLSRLYNYSDAVCPHDRYPWVFKNPYSLWTGSLNGKAELMVQLHALSGVLPDIYRQGRILESQKTADDVLSSEQIRDAADPLQWYLELAILHHQCLERHPVLTAQGLTRGIAGIITMMRPRYVGDNLVKLATGRSRDMAVIHALSLHATGVSSPQNGLPVVGTSVSDLAARAESRGRTSRSGLASNN